MFFYSTKKKFPYELKVSKLTDDKSGKWLKQVAEWVENKWGYIRSFPGIDFREKSIQQLKDYFYIVTYADQPVGMFALIDKEDMRKGLTKELMYLYVDESFRDLGVGSKIMRIAKEKCQEEGTTRMVLDTLNTNLNGFYNRHGAKWSGESLLHFKGRKEYKYELRYHPTDAFTIELESTSPKI